MLIKRIISITMAVTVFLTPALPTHIEAEVFEPPPIKVVSGDLVDHPVFLEKKPRMSQRLRTIDTSFLEEGWNTEPCNCWIYVNNRLGTNVGMDDFVPNSEPVVGGVSIEYFSKTKYKHVALITEVTGEGVYVEESNYDRCKMGSRFIPFGKQSLIGFWSSYGII